MASVFDPYVTGVNEYDTIPQTPGGGGGMGGVPNVPPQFAKAQAPNFNANSVFYPQEEPGMRQVSAPQIQHMSKEVAKGKQEFYGSIEKDLQMKGIKNPYIIDKLSKDVFGPAEEMVDNINKLQERGMDATHEINSLKQYLKSAYVKGEVQKAQGLQGEIDDLEKKFGAMSRSQRAGAEDPSLINPYDEGFSRSKDRYAPSEFERLEKKFRDTREHSSDNEYGLTREQAHRNLAGASDLHNEEVMSALMQETMEKKYPNLLKKVEKGEQLTQEETKKVRTEVEKRIAQMEQDYTNQMAHTKKVPKDPKPSTTIIKMGGEGKQQDFPIGLKELISATYNAQKSGKTIPIDSHIVEEYYGTHTKGMPIVSKNGTPDEMQYSSLRNKDVIQSGVKFHGKHNPVYDAVLKHAKSSGKLIIDGETGPNPVDKGRSMIGKVLITRDHLDKAFESYRAKHPGEFENENKLFGWGSQEAHEKNLEKFIKKSGSTIKKAGYRGTTKEHTKDAANELYSVHVLLKNPVHETLIKHKATYNQGMAKDIKEEINPSKEKVNEAHMYIHQ